MIETKFKFSAPEHGWMEVSAGNSEIEVTIDISDVPIDSICNLAAALLRLQAGSKKEEIEFSLEPQTALWIFEVVNEQLMLSVYPDSSRDNPVLFQGSKERTLHNLYNSLRDLESFSCWDKLDAINTVWSWEFPSGELNKFKSA